MRSRLATAVFCVGLLAAGPWVDAAPLGTRFTYQGQLKLNGSLCNGAYDLQFTLYDSATGGSMIGAVQIVSGVAVMDGQFTVALNAAGQFGAAAFNGIDRWLQIDVRPAGGGSFAALSPRQELTATPYALFSAAPWMTGASGISYSGGNVGIGTTTPVTPLSVRGSYTGSEGGVITAVNTSTGVAIRCTGYYGVLSYGIGMDHSIGILGYAAGSDGTGVLGRADSGVAVRGESDGDGSTGVYGEVWGSGATGVIGASYDGHGVYGSSGTGYGVYGSSIDVYGVVGEGGDIGVWANNTVSGYKAYLGTRALAGDFYGNVSINGTLSKSAGSFKIDHPLDPANKYLSHSFVESPDMMNVYNGNVTTDANGEASVRLPDYFEALNRDFCYQLTVIGQFAQAIVFKEISGNQFTIRTDKPNVKVSWQVTGIRQDAYANAHRIPVEQDKPQAEKGKYLFPELHGQPATARIDAGPTAPPSISLPLMPTDAPKEGHP